MCRQRSGRWGEELMRGKLDGKPVSENLKLVDRMLKLAGLLVKEKALELKREVSGLRVKWFRPA